MAYLAQTSWRDRPGAVAAVVAIHGLIGYALITGMDVSSIITEASRIQGETIVEDIPLDPPPPPEPDKVEPTETPTQLDYPVTAPLAPVDLSDAAPNIPTTPRIPELTDLVVKPLPTPMPGPSTTPSPRFNSVGALPRNDPGRWVTTADYRSSWINSELTGTARFRLAIAADGTVKDCTIIGTSGHPALDQATCALVTRRAKFDAAKDETGARTSGIYTSAVKWELPE